MPIPVESAPPVVSVPITAPENGATRCWMSTDPKNCTRFLRIGPLTEPPYWDCVKSVCRGTRVLMMPGGNVVAPFGTVSAGIESRTSAWFWRNPNNEPWNWFDPDLVTALINPPVNPPSRTSNGAISTWYSLSASTEMGCAFAWPPGVPLAASPNRSLFTPPSIWMLLKRLFWPPSVVPGTPAETTCGTVLTKSVRLRPRVGSRLITSPEIVDAAPVRDDDSSGFSLADTRSEEHTSELQSRLHLVCRLLLEKKKKKHTMD